MNNTATELLVSAVRFYDEFLINEEEQILGLVFFDEIERSSEFVCYGDWDQFLEQITAALKCGWRPIAFELMKNDEDFDCLELQYVNDEPSLEDVAIIDSLFEFELETESSES
jgi:hypothetical protein